MNDHCASLSDGLNSQQHQAVESTAKNLLIVAGPGSGKTHTLIRRIARKAIALTCVQKVLAMTFTHKAADEMRCRLNSGWGIADARAFVGTFHQWCALILHQYGGVDFSVASEEQCLDIAAALWPELSLAERKKRLQNISWQKSIDVLSLGDALAAQWTDALRDKHYYDFDGLLRETFFLLRDQRDIRKKIQDDYPEIFVDEYQDMNPVQHAILKLLVGDRGHITAIGDPDQAIYGFRGACVDLFDQFPSDFEQTDVIVLHENYRNAADVLAASCQVMKPGSQQASLDQIATIQVQGRLTVHESVTDKAEAEYVVHTIEQLVGGTSMFSQDSGRVERTEQGQLSFGDIAIFYRLKSQARALEKALIRSGMARL